MTHPGPHPKLPGTPIVQRLDARLRGPGEAALIEAEELASLRAQAALGQHAAILACLEWARRWAVAPLSRFEVGAAALGESGRLYLGANLEFRGLPLSQTVHAEQAVIAHAWAHAERALTLLATTAAPCGFCRQFMLELPEPRPELLLTDAPSTTLTQLLPAAFGPTELGRKPQLLRAGPHALALAPGEAGGALVELALSAASRSSAPYTGALSGVALETSEGRRFCGAVAESVAYNPTLAPMQAALIAAHHGGARLETISAAVLVELDEGPVSQLELARQILASVAPGASLRRCAILRS